MSIISHQEPTGGARPAPLPAALGAKFRAEARRWQKNLLRRFGLVCGEYKG